MRFARLIVLVGLLVATQATAAPIPVDLPPPADKPPTKDKPVRVYIMSGQSNMVGFGAIKPAPSHYMNIFLSPDPAVVPTALPVGNALLMPFGLEISAKDSKAGVVEAVIDVPFDGNYVVHPGRGPKSDCVAELDGKVVYRLDENGNAVREKVALEKGKRYPLRITSKQGGSAAFFLEQVDLRGYGDLGFVLDELGRFRYLRNDDGSWVKRPDVILNDAYLGKGQSAPLSVEACGPTFGPELGFGFVMGTFHEEPVLVIKADIGNRSLGWDILPPGSQRYECEGRVYPGYGENERTIKEGGKPRAGEWYAGKQYDDYTAAVHAVLDNFGEQYPEYKDQGYEVAGFVWWQGHKDSGDPCHVAHYEQNLTNLIKAWRKEFKAPNARFVIATGCGSPGRDGGALQIAEAQLAVADPKRHPEFAGNVKTIDSRPFWRDANISPKNQGYHYNHNAETYMLCGDALGRAMAELEGGSVEYPTGSLTKPIDAPPLLQPADEATLAAMIPAITPIVMDRLLPEFAGDAASIPSYLRRGVPLETILGGKAPAKASPVIESQLDQMIAHYDLCGIHTYDWKPFGPEMKAAEWQYYTFDPPETKDDPEGDRYRPVTLPAGMATWFQPDFDAAKAGWKIGKAPFGQKDGKQEPLIASCKVPYCGCSVPPATFWDKEVLLMRQTFEVPPLDANHRYRIVVGGAGHAWSGEGFALYVNGKLVSEATGGYYKGGGQARGAIVYDELLPEFAGGKVTIAVRAFLRRNGHRGKAAPPSGHMSVWMEAAELSPLAAEVARRLMQ